MKILNYTLQIATALSLATAVNSWAADKSSTDSIVGVLSGVPNSDLSAKAAEMVAQADVIHQPLITSDVVKAALQVNPAAAVQVVGGIAKLVPAMAANAALAAVSVNPSQVALIAGAAATAAPGRAGEIVKVLCRALPTSYRLIAEAVSRAVPSATREILAAVSDAIPSLKATIAQVEAMHEGGYLSVYAVLAEVGDVAQVTDPFSSVPTTPRTVNVKPKPIVTGGGNPPPTLPPIVTPSEGGSVPSGGRNDAAL